MNTSVTWIVGLLVVLAAGAGVYIVANPAEMDSMQKDVMTNSQDSMKDESAMMEKPDGAMMDKSTTTTDTMMKKDEGTMMAQ